PKQGPVAPGRSTEDETMLIREIGESVNGGPAQGRPDALCRELLTSTAGRDRHSGSTGFDVDLRAHLTAPAGAHTAETTVGKPQLPTTTATPLSPSRRKRVDVRGARVARRRHHTSWTGALRRRPVETQTVVEASTPRRQGPLRALRAATRVSEGVFWSFADPGSIPGESTSQKQWAKGRVMPARRELITRGERRVNESSLCAACPRAWKDTSVWGDWDPALPERRGSCVASKSHRAVTGRRDVTAVRARRFTGSLRDSRVGASPVSSPESGR